MKSTGCRRETQCSLAPFPDEVGAKLANSPGRDSQEEMARYAEDVYYETAIKLAREAAQVKDRLSPRERGT